jgi:enterochelin esterase family protein
LHPIRDARAFAGILVWKQEELAMKRILLCAAATIAVALMSSTQSLKAQFPVYTSPPPPWVNGGGLPEIKPVEVLSDHRITFRIKAAKVASASVSVGTEHADLHVYPMTKDAEGIWIATIDRPVPQGIYPYRFEIDGVTVHSGDVEVPGAQPAIYDVQNVPHGSYGIQNYFSKERNATRVLGIYLPAEYFSEPARRFPVLYSYDDPLSNIGGMRYREIMDNLIAEKKAVPMIMVMMIEDSISGTNAEPNRQRNSKEFAEDIMPLVDRFYRTIPDRDHRAMAGISHNGGATWTTGLNNLDKVSYMGLLSSGMFGGLLARTTGPYPFATYAPWEPDKVLPDATKAMLAPGHQLKLFYLSDGDIDPRVNPTRSAAGEFKQYGVTPVFEVYPGGHQPKAFRPAFVSFVSLLFK